MFSYKPLWKQLIDKNMNKGDLREICGLSTATMAKLGKNEYVSMEILDRICKGLNCSLGDIVEHITDK